MSGLKNSIFDMACVASNDNRRVRYRGGYPLLRWLIKRNPEAALAVFHYINTTPNAGAEQQASPSYLDPRENSADDADGHDAPDKPWASLDDLSTSGENIDEMNLDRLHEVTPALHELLRSAGGIAWPWSGVRKRVDGKTRWVGEPWAYHWTETQRLADTHKRGSHVFQLGGLTYFTKPEARRRHPGGMLVSFINDKEKKRHPNYQRTKPRGGKKPYRTAARIERYLSMPAVIASPLDAHGLRTPFSGEPALQPTYHPLGRRAREAFMDYQSGKIDEEGRFGVMEVRQVLIEHGVDGSVPFDELPFPATKCPTRRAKGARFIAGISAGKQTKSASAIGRAWTPELALPPHTAAVLDEVAARGNLTSTGIRLGKSKGYADRYAKMALLAAAKELMAANDNQKKKLAA